MRDLVRNESRIQVRDTALRVERIQLATRSAKPCRAGFQRCNVRQTRTLADSLAGCDIAIVEDTQPVSVRDRRAFSEV